MAASSSVTNGDELLLAAPPPEANVIDALWVMLGPAIDNRVVRLEAALGQVDGLAKRSLAVLGGDAKVQSCGAVGHENPLSPNTAKQEISRFVVTGTGEK
jgi:hypothetical protein